MSAAKAVAAAAAASLAAAKARVEDEVETKVKAEVAARVKAEVLYLFLANLPFNSINHISFPFFFELCLANPTFRLRLMFKAPSLKEWWTK